MRLYYVYILKCSDGSYYTGMTNDLERRLIEHQTKASYGYTYKRLPVKLVWYLECSKPDEAIGIEKKIKGWSRKKKEALINENWDDLVRFSKNYTEYGKPKTSSTSSD
ncbi:GIY-YIG nuclease family protein [Winogradskyella algicola]|uniref:GIY-YIG nuclease family protein n=1 Tax=Winogradskyella algicola TaxID=2575815 RepID=UPI001109174B|nr:GIY-YIG nuclease family protein [Winogradskyella algicola]